MFNFTTGLIRKCIVWRKRKITKLMCSVSALIMAKRKYKTLSSVVSVLVAYNLTEEKDRFVLEWRLGKHANYKIP